MSAVAWTEFDTQRAKQYWAEYVASHDLSDRVGQAAGIDPVTGQVWFGESAAEIARQLKEAGTPKPLFFMRVGYKTYLRKGGRRLFAGLSPLKAYRALRFFWRESIGRRLSILDLTAISNYQFNSKTNCTRNL
jgi:hypothetical protein